MKHYFLVCALGLLGAAAGTVIACSSDDTSTSGGDAGVDGSTEGGDNPGGTGQMTPTVTYTGTATGKLAVSADKNPPGGAEGFSGVTSKTVTFPGADVTLPPITDLAPGTYDFLAVLDVGGNNPEGPGPEDPIGFMPGVEIKAGDSIPLTFELVPCSTTPLCQGEGDPDGGADGGDGG